MNEYELPYEQRKTIRFSLEPKEIGRVYEPIKSSKNLGEQLQDFITQYQSIITNLEKQIFFNKDGKKSLKKKICIKHAWLRTYTKTEFYNVKYKIIIVDNDGRKRDNKSLISDTDLSFLKEYFENWIIENQECVNSLQSFLEQPEESQKRISEFAYWIQRISKRSNFEALFELFNENINHKDSNEEIDRIKKVLNECKLLLKTLEKELLPSQSLGLEIERASLNYYTVNKKPKDYDEEINKKKEALSESDSFQKADIDLFTKVEFTEKDLPIGDLKQAMKVFKANQKSKFYEFVNQNKSYDDLQNNDGLKLLNDIIKANFNKFKSEKDKQKRGKHFQFSFSKYKKFCNIYKNIVVKYGQIKAKIKTLEKEKIDAERMQSWAMILEKDNQKYILTIPRDAHSNLPSAKNYINGLKDELDGTWKLHAFESLTLRALDKLCFGLDKNTFLPTIKDELQQKDASFLEAGNLKRKDQFSDDGLELIKFYQTVLGLDATRKVLAISDFKGLAAIIGNENYENKEEFEKDLKQACYYKKAITISKETKNTLVKSYKGNLYKITSYDLQKKDNEEINKLENKQEFDRSNSEVHTKIWLNFWTVDNTKRRYDIRLNPELKISFVEKKTEELKDENLGMLKKNRRQEDRYLLSTTITLQAHKRNADLSFKGTDEIVNFIQTYNDEFNKNIKPFDIYYYGLDRGQKELLTLGVFKFLESKKIPFTKQDNSSGKYYKPEFIPIEAYELKSDKFLEQNEKGRIAYKSISEFIDNTDIVKKKDINSCFDMSTAKLIKDKIVINGDIATYLELKRISALRKIYEGTTQGKFKSENICFNADKGALFLNIENRGKLENKDLYFYDERFASILSLNDIKKELQDYYSTLKNKGGVEIITIDKVNNLRDALCANAVGILNHLQKQFSGMMFFENLDISNKNQRISEFSGNLGSRIEWKLLQKFQTLNLVPPNYKQAMILQSKKSINQLGIIAYIKTSGTSNECPHCGTKNSDKTKKWQGHAYECINSHCLFSTEDKGNRQGLDCLDDSDKVASYNIAKRGLDFIIRKK